MGVSWPVRKCKRADEPESVSLSDSFVVELVQGKSEVLQLISRSYSCF